MIKTIIKILVAAIVAAGMAVVLVVHGVSGNMVVMTDFCLTLVLCAIFGVFDERKESKHDSIKHYDGRRNYGHAA